MTIHGYTPAPRSEKENEQLDPPRRLEKGMQKNEIKKYSYEQREKEPQLPQIRLSSPCNCAYIHRPLVEKKKVLPLPRIYRPTAPVSTYHPPNVQSPFVLPFFYSAPVVPDQGPLPPLSLGSAQHRTVDTPAPLVLPSRSQA